MVFISQMPYLRNLRRNRLLSPQTHHHSLQPNHLGSLLGNLHRYRRLHLLNLAPFHPIRPHNLQYNLQCNRHHSLLGNRLHSLLVNHLRDLLCSLPISRRLNLVCSLPLNLQHSPPCFHLRNLLRSLPSILLLNLHLNHHFIPLHSLPPIHRTLLHSLQCNLQDNRRRNHLLS